MMKRLTLMCSALLLSTLLSGCIYPHHGHHHGHGHGHHYGHRD
ncbi:hypothetical protein [Nissabacter sp. SGAir0207]|nr:hypothetical protein [Nissabacter sp. SGAir0207]